jgi:hypothetical protein
MQIWQCAQCGRQIGGQHHAMVRNNKKSVNRKEELEREEEGVSVTIYTIYKVNNDITPLQNFNVGELGYDDHLNEVDSQTYRQLDAPSLRILRIVMHACMFWSRSMNIDPQYTR